MIGAVTRPSCAADLWSPCQNSGTKRSSRGRIDTMSLPGFTASNSLWTSSGRYRASSVVLGGGHSAIGPQLRAGGGSAGETADDCVDTYQNCYINCSVSYPESADSQDNLNAMMRAGCFDSCDATYDLC